MPRSSESSSRERPKEKMVTLPPIRDIFREQLASPAPHSSPYLSRSSQSSRGSTHSTFASEYATGSHRTASPSPDMRYRTQSSATSSASQRTAGPALRPSLSHGTAPPETSLRQRIPEHHHLYGSPPTLTAGQALPPTGHNYASSVDPSRHGPTRNPASAGDSSRMYPSWTEHGRQDSAESLWSTHSSSNAASSQPRSIPPASNALQFQPLPHAQMASSSARQPTYSNPHNPSPADYHSPFGVLIADEPRGAFASDPQRAAILRSLRTPGVQGSFQITFDDPASAQNPPRYSCQYCGKGFARPSSLRIHINSHTGEKPFKCPHPDCGRRFSVHSNMRRHYRVHGGDAPKGGEAEVSGDEGTEE